MAIMTANGPAPPAPSRSASFQKMLELEKKYKLERLQGVSRPPTSQGYPPSSLPTHHHHHHHQPQQLRERSQTEQLHQPQYAQTEQRSGSFSQEQNLLMLKAVRRSVALPSLSISIPPPPTASNTEGKGKQPQQASESRSNGGDDEQVARADGAKSVSFLAPEEASISDEESICQSPTWEGYKEAEKKKKEEKKQKKKEKEQASKDAKLAKKRLTARLSKTAPNFPGSKEPSPAPHNRKLLRSATEPLSIEYPSENPGDAQHALAKLTGQPYVPSGKRPPTKGTNSFVGGVKLAAQSEETVKRLVEAREKAIERDQAAATNPSAVQPKAFSITPGNLPRLGRKTPATSAGVPSKDKEKEQEKEATRPPVTMHTMFRQGRSSSSSAAPNAEDILPEPNRNSLVPHNRSTPTLLQHASTAPAPETRGRPGSAGSSSYVRSSREQSSERAISGFREEYKVAGFFHRFRASSQPPKESQPRSAAPSTPGGTQSPELARSMSPGAAGAPRSASSQLRIYENSVDDLAHLPPPPRVSSPTVSERSSKTSLRKFGSSSQTQLSPGRKPSSPTFSFTSNMTSYFEHKPLTAQLVDTPEAISESPPGQAPKIPEVATTPTLSSEFDQATKSPGNVEAVASGSQSSLNSQADSRTSERSSSSSYAESRDVSAPVSPATTPDTSRPQSQKGGISGQAGNDAKDDDGSLPEAFHAISFDVEPSQDDGQSNSKAFKDSDDSWSRSALPIDIDQQSVMTSMSNLDLNDSKASLPQRPPISSASSHASSQFEDAQESIPAPTDANQGTQKTQTPPRDISFLPPLKHQSLAQPQKAGKPGSKPESRIFPVISTPQSDRSRSMSPAPSHASKAETLRSDDSEASSNPASYLQEARKSTQAPPPMTALKPILRNPQRASGLRQSSLAVQNQPGLPDKPMAKMFVECCHCKFFHDMPSKVYECMVTPDSFVEDRRLGVSGAITTMVKCPWCAHNMSRDCCAGYMALVMLQQKLH